MAQTVGSEQDQEKKSFKCPSCHKNITFGINQCPYCHVNIFYRDMSETFWNKRKQKLLKNSSAISN